MTVYSNTQFTPILTNIEASTQKPEAETKAIQILGAVHDATLPISWSDRAIQKLDQWETDLVDRLPCLVDTQFLDDMGHRAEQILNRLMSKLAPLQKLNEWLDTNELQSDWDSKLKILAVFLVKLPLRAVRNIINMLVNIIKAALYTAVHPAKAAMHLAKLMVKFAEELTKPETWSKIGVGTIGASFGQAAVGNPLSIVGLIIGTALTIGGLSAGAIIAALKEDGINAKFRAAGCAILKQAQALPEAMLTAFCLGLLLGGVQKLTSSNPIDDAVNAFVKKHNIPLPDYVQTEPNWFYSLNTDQLRLRWHYYNAKVAAIADKGLVWAKWNHVKTITFNPLQSSPSVIPTLIAGTASGIIK